MKENKEKLSSGEQDKKKSLTTSRQLPAGIVISVNISERKGVSKDPVELIVLKKGYGVVNDAHGGGKRQVSVLALESAKHIKNFKPGLFAENITTKYFDMSSLVAGDIISAGEARIRLTEKGKVCPRKCSIYYKLGDCIMPKEGLFFEVIKEGIVKVGDSVELI